MKLLSRWRQKMLTLLLFSCDLKIDGLHNYFTFSCGMLALVYGWFYYLPVIVLLDLQHDVEFHPA